LYSILPRLSNLQTHLQVQREDLILEQVHGALGATRVDVLYGSDFVTEEDTFDDLGIEDGGRLMVAESGQAIFSEVVRELVELNTVEAGGNGPTQREILQQWGGEEPDFWNESRVVGDWNLQSLGLVALPSSIGDLTISSSLQLSRNRIKSLPDSFGNLTIVGDLLLDRNGLETLPETFGSIAVGAELHLGSNKLQSLPASFSEVKARFVILSKNPGYNNRREIGDKYNW